ncbi:hypothetical protein B0T22DRAFT_184439 [Podospora appendiculata]|uniref:Uncharacterized protein n=1 Tax=Podospora appendiculata TaxID=314037 RepID=A0AAE1CDU9_9PEZI|nr:hypothetical protein B0T22DRAFT_184439 [Podospora appendiculata]
MSSSGLLPGEFITSIDGRRCTAKPRANASSSPIDQTTAAAATTTSSTASASTTTAVAVVAVDNNTNAGTPLAGTELAGSTSTTSSSLVIITASTSGSSTSATQATQGETVVPVPVPPALVAAPPSAELPSTSSIVTPSQQAVQTSGIKTSQADSKVTASSAGTAVDSPATVVPDVTSSPLLNASATPTPFVTTIGTPRASTETNAAAEATDATTSTNSAVSAIANPNSNAVQSTVAVAGGVIGGVVAISVVAFFIWWWRRRIIKRRRSTLLTPLDLSSSFDRDEKGAYIINRGSIGPTPMATKLKAALGYNVRRIRGGMGHLMTKSGSPSVNLDRGNSQFMDPVSTHSRVNSSLTDGGHVTTKDRFFDWWTRLTADMNFNWRLRDKPSPGLPSFNSSNSATKSNEKKPATLASQPDFLTLLSMDDRQLDREAQRRRASISRKNGSASSTDHFLGGLRLNFGSADNPFSDANALAHASAQPAPLLVSQPGNPFSDKHAIRDPPPTAMSKTGTGSYVADIRRSRGQSVSGGGNDGTNNTNLARQPSTKSNRDSITSVNSFANRRNKFRSDPFDLERPELLVGTRSAAGPAAGGRNGRGSHGHNSITSSMAGTAGSRTSGGVGTGELRKPAGAHTRRDSFTSKYSSGVSMVSMGDWSDPGPDVGPAAARWDGGRDRESPTQGWRERMEREGRSGDGNAANKGDGKRQSGGSLKSVGKAM